VTRPATTPPPHPTIAGYLSRRRFRKADVTRGRKTGSENMRRERGGRYSGARRTGRTAGGLSVPVTASYGGLALLGDKCAGVAQHAAGRVESCTARARSARGRRAWRVSGCCRRRALVGFFAGARELAAAAIISWRTGRRREAAQRHASVSLPWRMASARNDCLRV